MREPYETLLGPYRDSNHWFMAQHLRDREPDFQKLMEGPGWKTLSTTEKKMVNIALAIYNGDRTATIADLAGLDRDHIMRVISAIYLTTVTRLGMTAKQFRDSFYTAVNKGIGDI